MPMANCALMSTASASRPCLASINAIGAIIEPNEGWMRLDGEVVYDNRWIRRDLRRLRLEKIGFIFQTHNGGFIRF